MSAKKSATRAISGAPQIELRPATLTDAKALSELELASFKTDRLSPRRIKHWIQAENGVMLVATGEAGLLGYALTLFHKGTRLARLYSIAVAKQARGQGIAKKLMRAVENACIERRRLFLRLEVATDNESAIALYKSLGFVAFGTYEDYYDDHKDALRMQKRIRYQPENMRRHEVPWYQQTTRFTCGPASLMMAMASLRKDITPNTGLELDLWREATTIFMTSGHGGCHPVGLALAAHNRGFKAEAHINLTGPLFVEGVRDPAKKIIIRHVDEQFRAAAKKAKVRVVQGDVTDKKIERWLTEGAAVLVLISTYRLDDRKTPHWVVVAGMDESCFYVHDPDPTDDEQSPMDCQYLPIARDDFSKMSTFGREKLRTAVVIRSTLQ